MLSLQTSTQAAQWLKQRVTGTLHSDSRALRPGDGFIAWPGTVVDARRYVPDALKRGAAACLVEHEGLGAVDFAQGLTASLAGLKLATGSIASEFFDTPSADLSVIAVTGTNGKTSTVWWLAQALSALPGPSALPCGMVGTLGVGRPPCGAVISGSGAMTSVIATGMTTPDPVLLQRTLRQFASNGLKACAMEASSIGIGESRLDGTHVRVAVFTNFTQDHLDYHGSMASYWDAKRRLFDWPGLECAVINVDDAQGAQLALDLSGTALDVWTVSSTQNARLRACAIAYESDGLRFDVVEGQETHALRTRMIGAYNVTNLLGVIASMRSLGVSLQAAVLACSELHAVPGRMECLGGTDEPLVVVDYAHTPDALRQVLAALRPLATQRAGSLWCVFGCGGDRDPAKRPVMGAIASQQADQVVVTSDNPRSERPEAIISQVLLGLVQSRSVRVQSDRAQAIVDAIFRAAPADVVLIAGKGHEATQEIAGVKYAFLDRAHAEQALLGRRVSDGEVRTCTP